VTDASFAGTDRVDHPCRSGRRQCALLEEESSNRGRMPVAVAEDPHPIARRLS
jgi:hypothetical protein